MYKIFEELCRKNDITPYRVSKETGVASSTLSDWKNGKSSPKQDKLQLIADFFDVPVSYLITGKEVEYFTALAEMDIKLTSMETRLKTYALKFAELSKKDQEMIMQMIDRCENI